MSIRDISGPGGRVGPPSSHTGRPRENPDRDSMERLERALKVAPKGRDEKEPDREEEKRRPEAGGFSGAAILRGLQGLEAGADLAGMDTEGRLAALSEIADRLLVSEPGKADKEIRILLKESLLPGAEVRLTLNDGALSVNFVCRNEQSALFLEQNRADLERRLEDRLGGPAKVLVNREETAEDQGGRSRGRRDLYAELANQGD